MNNLTTHEVKLLQDLIHRELDSVTTHTSASLVTQYVILLEKLEVVMNDNIVQHVNSIINEKLKTND